MSNIPDKYNKVPQPIDYVRLGGFSEVDLVYNTMHSIPARVQTKAFTEFLERNSAASGRPFNEELEKKLVYLEGLPDRDFVQVFTSALPCEHEDMLALRQRVNTTQLARIHSLLRKYNIMKHKDSVEAIQTTVHPPSHSINSLRFLTELFDTPNIYLAAHAFKNSGYDRRYTWYQSMRELVFRMNHRGETNDFVECLNSPHAVRPLYQENTPCLGRGTIYESAYQEYLQYTTAHGVCRIQNKNLFNHVVTNPNYKNARHSLLAYAQCVDTHLTYKRNHF